MISTKRTGPHRLHIRFLLATMTVFLSFPPVVAAQSTTTLRMLLPRLDRHFNASIVKVAETIARESSGRLKLKTVWTAEPPAARMAAVRRGRMEVTMVPTATLGIPILRRNYLFSGPSQTMTAVRAFARTNPVQRDLSFLGVWYQGAHAFVGHEPFPRPPDFHGKRIVGASDLRPLQVRTSDIPFRQWTAAFQENRLDGFETMLEPHRLRPLLARDAKITVTNHRFNTAVFLINSHDLSSLRPEDQQLLTEVLTTLGNEYGASIIDRDHTFLVRYKDQVSPADVPEFKDLYITPDIERDVAPLLVGGNSDCSSSEQCKCKTNTYRQKCTCHEDCKENSDCK